MQTFIMAIDELWDLSTKTSMTVNILSLGIDMIVAVALIGCALMLVITLLALVESIIEREFGAFVGSLFLALLLVGFCLFAAGLIIY